MARQPCRTFICRKTHATQQWRIVNIFVPFRVVSSCWVHSSCSFRVCVGISCWHGAHRGHKTCSLAGVREGSKQCHRPFGENYEAFSFPVPTPRRPDYFVMKRGCPTMDPKATRSYGNFVICPPFMFLTGLSKPTIWLRCPPGSSLGCRNYVICG